jgi:hypothetical protein
MGFGLDLAKVFIINCFVRRLANVGKHRPTWQEYNRQ